MSAQPYDLVIVISDLGSGGTQRVVSQIINHWSSKGKKIMVITLASAETDFFHLPESVSRCSIDGVRVSKNILMGLFANIKRVIRLRRVLPTLFVDNIIDSLSVHLSIGCQ